MPRLLNPQHEAFCRAFVRGPHAHSLCDAYESAGYARDSGNAARLARQPAIVARVNELRRGEAAAERHALRTALADLAVDKARIAKELATIAFANPLDYLSIGEDGDVKIDLARVARDKAAAVRAMSFECTVKPNGEKATKLHVRLFDKRQALLALDKQIDAAREPEPEAEPQKAPPDPYVDSLVQDESDILLACLRDFAEQGLDVVALAAQAAAAAQVKTPPWADGRFPAADTSALAETATPDTAAEPAQAAPSEAAEPAQAAPCDVTQPAPLAPLSDAPPTADARLCDRTGTNAPCLADAAAASDDAQSAHDSANDPPHDCQSCQMLCHAAPPTPRRRRTCSGDPDPKGTVPP